MVLHPDEYPYPYFYFLVITVMTNLLYKVFGAGRKHLREERLYFIHKHDDIIVLPVNVYDMLQTPYIGDRL